MSDVTSKRDSKAPEAPVRARPTAEAVDAKAFAEQTLRDFPKIMAELAK